MIIIFEELNYEISEVGRGMVCLLVEAIKVGGRKGDDVEIRQG